MGGTPNKKFICEVCKRHFLTSNHLISHLVSHTGEKPFDCEVCQKKFAHKRSLDYHMDFHKGIRYHCMACPKHFSKKNRLKKHLLLHKCDEGFVSTKCSRIFPLESSLEKHKDHGRKMFQCNICQLTFVSKENLEKHFAAVHLKVKLPSCGICRQTFMKQKHLDKHMKTHFNVICNLCSKTFLFRPNLKRFMGVQMGDVTFLCKRCQDSLSQKSDLKYQSKRYKCFLCQETFAAKGYLNIHLEYVHSESSEAVT